MTLKACLVTTACDMPPHRRDSSEPQSLWTRPSKTRREHKLQEQTNPHPVGLRMYTSLLEGPGQAHWGVRPRGSAGARGNGGGGCLAPQTSCRTARLWSQAHMGLTAESSQVLPRAWAVPLQGTQVREPCHSGNRRPMMRYHRLVPGLLCGQARKMTL